MKLEDQICTLDQAKKLKELGVGQDSAFQWNWFITRHPPEIVFNQKYEEGEFLSNLQQCAAFTVAELGVMLPRNISSFHCGYDLWRVGNSFNYASSVIEKDNVSIFYRGELKTYADITGSTEAQSRAEMLIYLLENNLHTI